MPRYPTAYRTQAVRARYTPLGQPRLGIQKAVNDNIIRRLPQDTRDYERLLSGDLRRRLVARRIVQQSAKRAVLPASRLIPGLGLALTVADIVDYRENLERQDSETSSEFQVYIAGLVPRDTPDFSGWSYEYHGSFDHTPVINVTNTVYPAYSIPDPVAGSTVIEADYIAGISENLAGSLTETRAYVQWQTGIATAYTPDRQIWGTLHRYYRSDAPAYDPFLRPDYQVRLRPSPQVRNAPGRPLRQIEWYEPEFDVPPDGPAPKAAPFVRPNDWSLSTEWTVDPGNAPAPAPRPAPISHPSTPPRNGTKERKWHIMRNGMVRVIWGAFGSVTEFSDLVDSLWKALPKSAKGGYYLIHPEFDGRVIWGAEPYWKWRHNVDLQRKVQDLWEHFGEMDLQKAIENVIFNQLQDAAIGKLGKAAQDRARPILEQLGRPVGFGFGPAI